MNKRRNAWVKETVARMRTAEKNDPTSVGAVIVNNEKVIVTITKNIDNPRIGVAMVNGDDEFDLDTGLAIAYTKAKGQELPCFITCDCWYNNNRIKGKTLNQTNQNYDDYYDDDEDYEDDDYEDEDYDEGYEDDDYEDEDYDEDDDRELYQVHTLPWLN
jgi:hypothetical protein